MTTINGSNETVSISFNGSNLIYTQNGINTSILLFPISISNTDSSGSSTLTIQLSTDINFNNANEYFNINTGYITINGNNKIVSLNSIIEYDGLIRMISSSGIPNVNIQNLNINCNTSSLSPNKGWFLANSNNIISITNCSSNGPIGYENGGIIGSFCNGITIQNCSSSGDITSRGGGITGISCNSITISGCSSTGNIVEDSGGIMGNGCGNITSCSIVSCYSTGNIGNMSGGIIAPNCKNINISNCFSNGNISSNAGGICGPFATSCNISNCYSTGIIGENSGGICSDNSDGVTILNCYSTGDINPSNLTSSTSGGICSLYYINLTIKNCYTSGNGLHGIVCIVPATPGTDNFSITDPGTTSSSLGENNYSEAYNNGSGWSDSNSNSSTNSSNGLTQVSSFFNKSTMTWYSLNNGRPYSNVNNIPYSNVSSITPISGAATGNETITISSNGSNFSYIKNDIITPIVSFPISITNSNTSGTYTLTIQISMNMDFNNINQYFIVNTGYVKISGNNRTISINNISGYGGLVRMNDSSGIIIPNVSIENLNINCNTSTLSYGKGWILGNSFNSNNIMSITNCSSNGPIGYENGGIVGSNCNGITIQNCSSSGDITSGGGIIGSFCNSIIISGSISNGNIGNNSGGIMGNSCGLITTCSISKCYSTGNIGNNSGGIIGNNCKSVSVDDCFSNGNISDNAGGICGPQTISCNISKCYSKGTIGANSGGICSNNSDRVSILNCYSTGNFIPNNIFTNGGICASNFTNLTITNCYTSGIGLNGIFGGSTQTTDNYNANTVGNIISIEDNYSEANNNGTTGWSDIHSNSLTNSNKGLTEVSNIFILTKNWYSLNNNNPYYNINIITVVYGATIADETLTFSFDGDNFSYTQDGVTTQIFPFFPIICNSAGPFMLTIKLDNDVTLSNPNQFFIVGTHNVTFDFSNIGRNYTITNTAIKYPGLISSYGNENIIIKNINLYNSGGSLAKNGGWILQPESKGLSTSPIIIESCYSNGNMDDNNGGISGFKCTYLDIHKCYSLGNMINTSGGIFAVYSENISCVGCYSNGLIGFNSGGIGVSNGLSNSISNSYSTGNIADLGGGIYAGSPTECTITNCYTSGLCSTNKNGIFYNFTYDNPTGSSNNYSEANNLNSGNWLEINANSSTNNLGYGLIFDLIWVRIGSNIPYLLINNYKLYNNNNFIEQTPFTSMPGINEPLYSIVNINGDSPSNFNISINNNSGVISILSGVNTVCDILIINYNLINTNYYNYYLETITFTPINNICFLAGSIIETDQGNINIENIDIKYHTINNNKIIELTKTILNKEKIICIKKNGIYENYPNIDTFLTMDHKILFNKKLMSALLISVNINDYERIREYKYNGEFLYNIRLEKYNLIKVNNLIADTLLEPSSISRRKYVR